MCCSSGKQNLQQAVDTLFTLCMCGRSDGCHFCCDGAWAVVIAAAMHCGRAKTRPGMPDPPMRSRMD